jgi:hemerythrin-like domain-containing protein
MIMADGFEILSEDHRQVERLFDSYGHDPEESIAHDICARLSVHTRVEEAVLYPALRRYVDGGDDLADVAEQEHAVAKSIIARIDDSPPDRLFDLVAELRTGVEHHIESEESELFPQMRESGVDAGLLGAEIEGARRAAEANTTRSSAT